MKDNLLSKYRFLTILDGIFYELTFFVFPQGRRPFFIFTIFRIFQFFQLSLGKKQKNVSFYGVCMYVRPKLTFVSFYFCFFIAPFPKASVLSCWLTTIPERQWHAMHNVFNVSAIGFLNISLTISSATDNNTSLVQYWYTALDLNCFRP